jgi:DNA-binding protein HU-beta
MMAKKQASKPAKGGAKGNNKKGGRPMSRSAVLGEVAEKTDLPRKKVAEVFDVLTEIMTREVSSGGAGQFKLPTGHLTVKRVHRKERPAREGRNPRTGEPTMIPAKPAHYVIKAYALKSLRGLA